MKHMGLRHNSPSNFGFRQRLILATAPRVVWCILRGISLTCRVDVIDRRYLDEVEAAHPTILAGVWHDSLAMAINIYRNRSYYTITSQSFDGELAARCCQTFGVHAVRGSSSRGGANALRELIRASEQIKGIGFTLDGPRGPRREAKPGIAYLSARTGLPVLPVAFAAHPAWRLNSWDRMTFPKPFSRITCAFGPPIQPPVDSTPGAIEDMRLRVETSLNEVHAQIEQEGA